MESFLAGLFLGYGASVPVGPVNILIMAYALKGFKFGFGIGLGAMSTDMFYLVLMSLGVLVFLDNQIISVILGIFGTLFLLYIAYLTFKGADKLLLKPNESDTKENTFFGCYTKGLLLNLVNPYIIAFWLSVSSFTAKTNSVFLSLLGLVVAISSWIFALPFAVSKSRKFISEKVAKIFAYVSSALMVFFALMIVYNTFLKS